MPIDFQFIGDHAAETPIATKDHVAFEMLDLSVHCALPDEFPELAAHHNLGDRGEHVVGGADADKDDHDREEASRRIERLHLLVADGGDRNDRHVKRIKERHPLDEHVTGAARQRQHRHNREAEADAAAGIHRRRSDPRVGRSVTQRIVTTVQPSFYGTARLFETRFKPALGIQRGHASSARRRDRLPINPIGHVAGGEDAFDVRVGRTGTHQ